MGSLQMKDSNREAFELVVANKLQNSLYHSVFFNEATGWYDCADDAPAAVQFFCCGLNSDWRIWKAAKAQAVPDGFVVVPVQCPDPDFADMLFDELSKNAIGEFGDDLLIHFSDIDEEKIWDLMLEAAQEPAND